MGIGSGSPGSRRSKAAAVAIAEAIATELGLPIVNEAGRNIYGRHVRRLAGVVHRAPIGLGAWFIQILFRRASATVLRYVTEASLGKVAD